MPEHSRMSQSANFRLRESDISWRSTDHFPSSQIPEWTGERKQRRQMYRGRAEVLSAIKRWHPLDSLLVGTPQMKQLLPPIQIPELSKIIFAEYQRRSILVIGSLVIGLLLCAIFSIAVPSDVWRSPSIIFAGLLGILLIEYLTAARNIVVLQERSLFYQKIVVLARYRPLYFWGGMMVIAGLLQIVGEYILGNHENLVVQIGIMYETQTFANAWRFLVGPFIHSGLGHWVVNASMLVFAGYLCDVISRKIGFIVFIIGSSLGGVPGLVLAHINGFDAYVGVSAGVSAMLGFVIAHAVAQPERFPLRLGFSLTILEVGDIGLASLLNPNAFGFAHVTGLYAGLLLGFLHYQALRRYNL